MATFFVLLFVVFTVNVCYGEDDVICHNAFELCVSPADAVVSMNPWMPLPGENFLREHCTNLVGKLECFVDKEKTCPVPPWHRYRSYKPVKEFIQELCNEDSELRQDYAENIPCINENYYNVIQQVGSSNVISEFHTAYGVDNSNSEVMEAVECIRFDFMLSEMKKSVTKYCGEAASNIFVTMGQFVGRIPIIPCNKDDEITQQYRDLFETFLSEKEDIIDVDQNL